MYCFSFFFFFFFNDTATTEIYTLSLHDALPIFWRAREQVELQLRNRGHRRRCLRFFPVTFYGSAVDASNAGDGRGRSEEHTSELQSQSNLVCRLLLGKKK